ncbi:MAG: hypothetical protein JSS11_02310 [Verrucomicrobia bacterium]|nr:hypothetical protein [Verrucomicrobiota bacterium]
MKKWTPLYKDIATSVACIVLVFIISCRYLGGLGWLNGVPVQFTGDASYSYTYAKAVLQSGWNWFTPYLGAPFGFPLIAFPSTLTYETIIMSVLRFTTHDPVTLLNRTWAVCLCLAGFFAYASFRMLGVRRALSFALGTLFAIIPYAFYRNVAHFSLEFSLISLPCALVILTLSNETGALSRQRFACLAFATALLGLGYIYYTFFICFLLAAAIVIAALRGHGRRSILRTLLCLALLLCVTLANLAPTLVHWSSHGKAPNMDYKNPAESELYALRIRDLVLPDQFSPIPPLAAAGKKSAEVPWPISNENTSAKIGTIGAIGFVLALFVLFGAQPRASEGDGMRRNAAAVALLLLLLLSVPGAFGSIFNLFVSADIRAYNRVAPLVGFVSLFMLGSWMDSILPRTGFKAGIAILVAVVFVVFGYFDQDVSARWRNMLGGNAAAADRLRHSIKHLETALPKDSMIFMLPLTGFPPDWDHGPMESYDHAKPTLFSHSLRWSWPQFSLKHESWLNLLGSPSNKLFYERLRQSGFTHVWIDHFGMQGQDAAVAAALQSAGAKPLQTDLPDRYAIYELVPRISTTRNPALLEAVTVDFVSGFYPRETTASGQPYHWARSDAVVVFQNTSKTSLDLNLSFLLQSFWSESSNMTVSLRGQSHHYAFSSASAYVSLPLHLDGLEKIEVHFSTDAKAATLPNENRDLHFGLIDLMLNTDK